ncbi:MAG: FdtA/QdtA family cupin domain-containing protein [Hydrotalea sp.]|nr:FdtA/QdtA family cupin domain-containing protein [Hydrotalea sp.]
MMMLELCKLVNLPRVDDERGSLSFVEENNHVPFAIARIFYLYDIANGATRGDHAHKRAKQFFIAIHGSFDIMLDDGQATKKITLDKPDVGLYVPAMIWSRLDGFSQGAVCLVLTDQLYDADDYIRHHPEFLTAVKTSAKQGA